MSLATSRPGCGCRDRSSSVSRDGMSFTIALTVRVPCLSSTRCPTVSGASATWQTVASTSCVVAGASCVGTIRSPRETSMSSASSTVTDCVVQATSTGSPSRSMPEIVEVRPDGRTVTRSPTRNVPAAIWPA